MEVLFLGTGAPLAPTRAATGLLVTAPGCEPLLLDTCGGFELPRQLGRVGFPLVDLRNVIVTHRHMDHAGGVPALLLANIPLTLYASEDCHAGLRDLVAATYPEWSPHAGVYRVTVAAGDRHEIGGFEVEFFAMQHRVPTVAVRVTCGEKVLAFSADSLPCDALVACARNADLFICDALCAAKDGTHWETRTHELMHPVAREAAQMATAANARALALVHLARFTDPQHIRDEAAAHFGGTIIVPDDCTRLMV